jgi:formate--tetrahydrofolate ligase
VNLEHHIQNVRQFGMELVVAINRFGTDTDAELAIVREAAEKAGARVALCEVFAKGGAGGEALAREVLDILKGGQVAVRAALRRCQAPDQGEDRHDRAEGLRRRGRRLQRQGRPRHRVPREHRLGRDARSAWRRRSTRSPTTRRKLGRPSGFRVTVNDVYPVAGAGFIVAQCGEIMTMPGLPKAPAAEKMAMPSGWLHLGPLLELRRAARTTSAGSGGAGHGV